MKALHVCSLFVAWPFFTLSFYRVKLELLELDYRTRSSVFKGNPLERSEKSQLSRARATIGLRQIFDFVAHTKLGNPEHQTDFKLR